jgi:DNA-binding transcriptional regulator GbsR (MarR family)
VSDQQPIAEREFVEEFGIVMAQTGLPRMAGRILGWLLISDPSHQSSEQLVKGLEASKGSISSMTRFLIQVSLIERMSLPGIRRDYFRIRPDAWPNMIRRGLEDEIKMVRQLAERALGLLADKPPLTRQWLEEMCNVYNFLEREFPTLLERWAQQREETGDQPRISI